MFRQVRIHWLSYSPVPSSVPNIIKSSVTICWTGQITFRNLCTQWIIEHIVSYVDTSWIIPFCPEKFVNFTQTCKTLLLFWSYVFEQRIIHGFDLATTFQRRHQYHLAKILTKSHYRGNSLLLYDFYHSVL